MSATVISPHPNLSAAAMLLASAELPTADLTEQHCEHFFYTGAADSPAGLIGLELFDGVALLRSLVVAPDYRGAGIGARLVEHAERHARSRGVRSVYLLTTTAETFFAHLGYTCASREAAPPAIRATREFAGICPASSSFMTKLL